MGRVLAFVLGALSGGLLWGAIEVAWITFQPGVGATWRIPSLAPPPDLGRFVAVALGTYALVGVLVGVFAGLVLAGRLRRATGTGATCLGLFLAGGGLAASGAAVWLNMRLVQSPLAPASLLKTAALGLSVWAAFGVFTLLLRAVLRRGTLVWLAAAAVLPAALVAFAYASHEPVATRAVASGQAAAGSPNLVLVTIDTLRADHVGFSTEGRIATPTMDALAAEGAWFEQAFSTSPHTTPSHVSMFTSVYPYDHGARNGVPMRPGFDSMAEVLRGAGYHTAAFISGYTTKSNVTGLGPGFDVYSDSLNPWMPLASDPAAEGLFLYRIFDRVSGNTIPAPVVNARFRAWLEDRPEQPFFLWLHYFDAHGPFEPEEGYRELYLEEGQNETEREIALYNAEITYTDHRMGDALGALRERGLLDDAVVVVTSDHGEAFREPNPRPEYGHGLTLYDQALRVPLVFWGPGRVEPVGSSHRVVETVDIAPTLLDLVGLAVPESYRGRSLASLLRGQVADVDDGEAFGQTTAYGHPTWFSLRSADWKLHTSPEEQSEELFDLRADPGETRNVVEDRDDVARQFRARLDEAMRLDRGDRDTKLDADTYERLKELGYITE